MSQWVIVAIPEEDDYVWKISSEQVPHMTLLFFGEQSDPALATEISNYLKHAIDLSMHRFGMYVDHRGELGPDKADVLFFEKTEFAEKVKRFRDNLLQNDAIRTAWNSAFQYPEWTPHLTLGYPETPAKEDDRDYPGLRWVRFDKIALWTDDYSGIEFQLKSEEGMLMGQSLEKAKTFLADAGFGTEEIEHYGVKGMRWGVRKDHFGIGSIDAASPRQTPGSAVVRNLTAPNKTSIKDMNKILSDVNKHLNSPKAVMEYNAAHKLYVSNRAAQGKSWDAKDYQKNMAHAFGEIISAHLTRNGISDMSVAVMDNGADRFHYILGDADTIRSVMSDLGGELVHQEKAVIAIDVEISPDRDNPGFTVKSVDTLQHDDEALAGLMHFGIKGMRWGIRRKVGKDGRVLKGGKAPEETDVETARTKARNSKLARKSNDKLKSEIDLLRGPEALSNADLKALNNRLQMEQTYSELIEKRKARAPKSKGQMFVDGLKAAGGLATSAIAFANSPAGKVILATLSKTAEPAAAKKAGPINLGEVKLKPYSGGSTPSAASKALIVVPPRR